MQSYSTSSITKKIDDMQTKAKGGKHIQYDESTNPFVQLYRWFAGTPWENFEEKLKEYGVTLENIVEHLEKNKTDFASDEKSVAKMNKALAEMAPVLAKNTTSADETIKIADTAKKDINNILEAHLKTIAEGKAKFDVAHDLEAKTRIMKQTEKSDERARKAKEKQDKIVEARTEKARLENAAQANKMK